MFGNKNKSAIGNWKSALCLVVCLFGITSCRRDMQDQPKMKAYRGSSFFGDGLSARLPVEGTVPRGYLRTDTALFTGKKNKSVNGATPTATPAGTPNQTAQAGVNSFPDDIDTFPFAITEDTVRRG